MMKPSERSCVYARQVWLPLSQRSFLLRRITRADRLIDFIVYRLYGLTESKVAVVEGSPSMQQE
jgi:hypothetical protein